MSILEIREYHVYTGKLPELVRLYAEEGIEIQKEVLGGFVGAYTTEVGELSTYVHLWRYSSFEDRLRRRGELQRRPDWKALLEKLTPLIHTQHNRILIPTSFSELQ